MVLRRGQESSSRQARHPVARAPSLVGDFHRAEIPPKSVILLKTVIAFDKPGERVFLGSSYSELGIGEKMRLLAKDSISTPFSSLSIETDNAIINRAVTNAKTDIFMLLTEERPEHWRLHPAGAPAASAKASPPKDQAAGQASSPAAGP